MGFLPTPSQDNYYYSILLDKHLQLAIEHLQEDEAHQTSR